MATIENVQQEANVAGQQAAIAAAKTDIASYIAAEKTAQANVEHAKADLEQKKLDWERAQAFTRTASWPSRTTTPKKPPMTPMWPRSTRPSPALNQAKAQTDSARGHLRTQEATLRANQNLLDLTIAVAPFDGIVTNEPVREGETVVEGIQNTEGSTLMTLADMSVITAEVKVDETDIVNIRIGQPADVTVDALPGKVFKGHVTLVGDQALLRSTGVATSQSTTGTEEAKDFKVVVTLDDLPTICGPASPPPPKSPPPTNQRPLPAHPGPHHARPGRRQAQGPAACRPHPPPAAKTPPVQGVYVVDKHKRQAPSQVRPRHHRHHRRHRYRGLGGLNGGPGNRTGPYKTLRALKNNALVKRDTAKPVTTPTSKLISSNEPLAPGRFEPGEHDQRSLMLRSLQKGGNHNPRRSHDGKLGKG